MITKKKGAFGAAICLLALLLSILTNPTVSRYVLERAGAILKTVITAPPISVTFMDKGTEIHIEEKLSSGMKLINLKTSIADYTYSDDTGTNTISFTQALKCPECNKSIVKNGNYIGCEDTQNCGVTFEGWMNASGNLPTEITVVRNIVLNAKWNIPNKYHLDFMDLDGNVVVSKQFTSSQSTVTITTQDLSKLNSAATAMGEKLTEESNGSMIVTATWEDYTNATTDKTYTMLLEDATVHMELGFQTTTNKTVQIEPHKDATGKIIDTNGDGYPDSYKVVDAILGDDTVDFTIPDYILGSPVTEIAGQAFAGDGKLQDVVIPNTITTIGMDAFTEYDTGIFGIGAEYPQIQLIYDGTQADWKEIAKDPNWDRNIGSGSVIIFLQEPSVGYITMKGGGLFGGNSQNNSWGDFETTAYPDWFASRYPDLLEYANTFHTS